MEQTSKDDESANPFVQMLSPEPFNVLFVHIIIHVSSLPEQSWNQQQYGHKFLEHKLKGLDPKKQFSFEVVYMCGLGSDWTIHLTLLCEISGQMIDTMKKPHHMKLQVTKFDGVTSAATWLFWWIAFKASSPLMFLTTLSNLALGVAGAWEHFTSIEREQLEALYTTMSVILSSSAHSSL